MKRILILLAAITVLCAFGHSAGAQATPPRVMIWDPVKGTPEFRFKLDKEYLDTVATWLTEAGCDVTRLTAEQINDPARFSAAAFDAAILVDEAIPRTNLPAYKKFLTDGGVLVNLGAGVPFFIRIEADGDGQWICSPKQPQYSWQTTEILDAIGLTIENYDAMFNKGSRHSVTPVFHKYVGALQPPMGMLTHKWLFAKPGATIYPLIRSQRNDGLDVTPQVFLIQNGKHRAIVASSNSLTGGKADVWPEGPKIVAGIARLAADLHRGDLKLTDDLAVAIPGQPLPGMRPLTVRLPSAGVDPEDAKPLVRWGKFDGSGIDFGDAVPAGEVRQLSADAANFPAYLSAGASVAVPLPDIGNATHLRIRGAYASSGANITATLGDQVILSETFVHHVEKGKTNLDMFEYGDQPIEFHRITYIPPLSRKATMLLLTNKGDKPVFFDAVQIEQRTQSPEVVLGLGAGIAQNPEVGSNPIDPKLSHSWSAIRATLRTQNAGGPDDPKRWEKIDRQMDSILAMSDKVHLIFEGTPAWAAISPERYEDGKKFGRPHTVVPDPKKYGEIVEHVLSKYGSKIRHYEIWNETNTRHFWRGEVSEWAAFYWSIVPIIRKHRPDALILGTGMAGTTTDFIDPWVLGMKKAGILDDIDWFCMHCYNGQGAWDFPHGLIEGHLYASGFNKPVYDNEQGFALDKMPGDKPAEQARRLDIGLARLMAQGVSKVNVFTAGPNDGHALFNKDGSPRPAYAVFSEYLPLAGEGARRLDVSMTRQDGAPVRGVYAAGSTHADGSIALILNPAETLPWQVAGDTLDESFNEVAGWNAFWAGTDKKTKGVVTVTPEAGRTYGGFTKTVTIDPRKRGSIEVHTTQVSGKYTLSLKLADKSDIPLLSMTEPGVAKAEFASKLTSQEPQEVEISFRVFGPVTFDQIVFPTEETHVEPRRPAVPLRVAFPLPKQGSYSIAVANQATPRPPTLTVHAGDEPWAEVAITITDLTALKLTSGDN